jgi:leader peptidase (prepilin peptidase)/N-methyltransferase
MWTWLGFATLAGLGLILARIDMVVLRLPDALVLPGYPLVGFPLTIAQPAAVPRALVASGACLLGYGLVCVLGSLGFGDVKLGGLLGLALGWISWPAVVFGVLAGLSLGAVHAVILVITRRNDRWSPVPFGPAMLLGALWAVLAA